MTQANLPSKYLEAAQLGMLASVFADEMEDRVALYSRRGNRTFRELNDNANRLANLLRSSGLIPGDSVALLCSNIPEFAEVYLAVLRTGMRLTPINWHLKADETAYIVNDCEAKALIAQDSYAYAAEVARQAPGLKLCVSIGTVPQGFVGYETSLAQYTSHDIDSPRVGHLMLYTSGTTGHPKGVFRDTVDIPYPQWQDLPVTLDPETDTALCCGPAYHAAPLVIDLIRPLCSRVPLVLMERFEAEELLQAIEEYRVTHLHLVPTMFIRLLGLSEKTRQKYDLSSLKVVIHGGAPCPLPVKRAMIEWLGPILAEYYAGTEGDAGIYIFSEEWLEKPGSVGKCPPDSIVIVDDQGKPAARGEIGKIYLQIQPEARLSYFKSPEKTRSLYLPSDANYISLGDRGYIDDEGYLYLSGRSSELIISGGVNIYPQEIDNVVLSHPLVADVCTIGIDNPEWGEEVKTVVQLHQPGLASKQLAEEIIKYVRGRLAHYKCPRSVDFFEELPRMDSGKVQRHLVRTHYQRR